MRKKHSTDHYKQVWCKIQQNPECFSDLKFFSFLNYWWGIQYKSGPNSKVAFFMFEFNPFGHLRVDLSVIKRCPLLGGSLTKIVTFGSKHFVRYLGCLLLRGFTVYVYSDLLLENDNEIRSILILVKPMAPVFPCTVTCEHGKNKP